MKFILVFQMCSIIFEACMTPFEDQSVLYSTFAECISSGYIKSLDLLHSMGVGEINRSQTIISFTCENIKGTTIGR